MKKVLIATTICTAMLASCGQNSAEYKKLKAENDSLRIENTKSNAEMDEILGTLNDVEADIQSIRDAENYLNIQQQKGDLNKSNREQIKENMQLISETLKKNKQQISELEEKLKKSGIQSAALRKTISRLSSELDQKANMIVTLQEDLAKKNVRIQELDEMVASLNEDVEDLSTTTAAQSEKLPGAGQETPYCLLLLRHIERAERPENPFRRRLVCQVQSVAERLQQRLFHFYRYPRSEGNPVVRR